MGRQKRGFVFCRCQSSHRLWRRCYDAAVRALVVAAPLLGHVLPLVRLATALSNAGHDVLIATAGDALTGRAIQLPMENVAPTFHFGRIATRTCLRHPLAV